MIEIKDLPEDIILMFFSQMGSREIVNTCLSHPRILGICERNQNFINRNILKKDYRFTRFQTNYNYTSIMVYMMNRFRIVLPHLNNPEMLMYTVKDNVSGKFNNYKEMLMYAVEPIASFDNIIVFDEFNNYNEMLTFAVQDNRIDVSLFLIENGANITVLGNFRSFNVIQTRVIYKDTRTQTEAERLAAAIGAHVIKDELVSPVADFTVLIGRDFSR